MNRESFATALESLHSERAEEVRATIARVGGELRSVDDRLHRAAIEALCSVFYIDTHERPDFEPCVEDAVTAVASAGERAIPTLFDALQGTDIRYHLRLARALGRIGGPALPALRRLVATDDDPYVRTFALLALANVAEPSLRQAIPEICAALGHPDKEVRDSAARALGKVAEVVPASSLSADRRNDMFDAVFRVVSDTQAAVRAKALHSLGRMARTGYLTIDQSRRVAAAVRAILGVDDQHEWDPAFIVRREATAIEPHLFGPRAAAS